MSKKKKRRSLVSAKEAQQQYAALRTEIVDIYEGQRLDTLLDKILRSIESVRFAKGDLPDKIWIKQHFAIGVNDVTRLLERMPLGNSTGYAPDISRSSDKVMSTSSIPLQVVLVAADCTPRLLTKHIPILASTRKVPVFLVKDGKGASFRLGALFNLTTALAIGVKARGSYINTAIEEFL